MREIGTGGAGRVYEATDALGGGRVAVKILARGIASDPPRVDREIAALRLLRLPGVVRLLGDGSHAGCSFLVMELCDGTPFPGQEAPCPWERIESVVLSFLETLARIHAAGVVHRDLKPANVLVGSDGHPVILDFGISYGPALGPRMTASGLVVGTPHYLSPEQILGRVADARSDLYAAGTMVFEALTGRLPFDEPDVGSLIRAKLSRAPPPLRRAAPGAPDVVCTAVDALLATDPSARPATAGEVARVLFGGDPSRVWGRRLPRVGSDAVIDALTAAARARRSLDIRGPRGSGRTRTLDDAATRVAALGRPVARTIRGSRPFESLGPALGTGSAAGEQNEAQRSFAAAMAGAATLDEATSFVEDRLRRSLADGVVIVADDAESLDRWSGAALARCRGAGTIWRAFVSRDTDDGARGGGDAAQGATPETVHLSPVTEADLRSLFAGPDRILHLREDGAAVLWERTEGVPSRIAAEISAWRRAGLVHDDGELIAITRDTVHRVRSGLPFGDAAWLEPLGPEPRSPESDDVLAWATLAWPGTTTENLTRAVGAARWQVEAAVDDLVADGCARRLRDGRIQPLSASASLPTWSSERRADAHRALAAILPANALARFRHELAGGDPAQVIGTARQVAWHLANDGHPADALSVLAEALAVVRSARMAGGAEVALVIEFAKASLDVGAPSAIDRACYELARVAPDEPELVRIAGLLRVVRASPSMAPRDVISDLDKLGPLADERLELWRHAQRARAANRLPLAEEADLLDEIGRRTASSPRATASYAGWLGQHLYRAGRFAEAAASHERSGELSERAVARLAAHLNASVAWIEAGEPARAAAAARRLVAGARERRHPVMEAWGEHLVRWFAYRSGESLESDPELLAAARIVGAPDIAARIALNEAAVAWRRGRIDDARDLALESASTAARSGNGAAHCLASAFAAFLGASLTDDDRRAYVRSAIDSGIPTITLQVIAFLRDRSDDASRARAAAEAKLPQGGRVGRMDVLALGETRPGP